MILKKLLAAVCLFTHFDGFYFDVVRFVDVFLICVARISHIRVQYFRDDTVQITVNKKHVFFYRLKRALQIIRPCLARFAHLYSETCETEMNPYENSFNISLPVAACVDAQKKYHVSYENTSIAQWIEFEKISEIAPTAHRGHPKKCAHIDNVPFEVQVEQCLNSMLDIAPVQRLATEPTMEDKCACPDSLTRSYDFSAESQTENIDQKSKANIIDVDSVDR